MTFNNFNEEVGLLQRGTIKTVNVTQGYMQVQLTNVSALDGNDPFLKNVPLPHSMFYNNGMFIGAIPVEGTPVVVGQGVGGAYYFVSFLSEKVDLIPSLDENTIKIQSNDDTKITLSQDNDIYIGNDDNNLHLNTLNKIFSIDFENQNAFSIGTRSIIGEIKRDLRPYTTLSDNIKLKSDLFDQSLFTIGMDPTVTTNHLISGSNKNPAFIEHRELLCEFPYESDIQDEYNESLLYSNHSVADDKDYVMPNRRKSRTDTLSLTLTSPNFLMESIKGTVVDIFGNILDINRAPLPIGQNQASLKTDGKNDDKQQSFLKIRELQRKSLAYHFEINARKDLAGNSGKTTLPDISSNDDYARNRSRFFIDIDKEGQFKINVPASSEKGNISLLTRYENYSTFGNEDNGNPNKLIFRNDGLDIFQDSFASPRISPNDDGLSISDDRGSIHILSDSAPATPIDRITGSHIKHGTAYHDILNTCLSHQSNDYINYADEWGADTFPVPSNLPTISVASDKVIVSGDNANAGGRSGSFSLDGSLEWNIGANTVDRQSLWADLAGGMVWNVGRDIRGNSAIMSMDGNVFWQVGGFGVSTDSRFVDQPNGYKSAILDIRVLNSVGRATMIRLDDNGVTIMSPGNIAIHSAKDLKISADANISIEAENVIVQGRGVLKEFGGSI